MASPGVRMHNIGISYVDDANTFEIGTIIFVIISARVTEGKKRGSLSYATRPKTGTCPPLRAKVEWRAQYRNIGVNSIPVSDIGAFRKSGNAHEW